MILNSSFSLKGDEAKEMKLYTQGTTLLCFFNKVVEVRVQHNGKAMKQENNFKEQEFSGMMHSILFVFVTTFAMFPKTRD